MKRNGGYVPDASDKSLGVPPNVESALTRIECVSCRALRQRIAELEAAVAALDQHSLADTMRARDVALADLDTANKRIEELEAEAEYHRRRDRAGKAYLKGGGESKWDERT